MSGVIYTQRVEEDLDISGVDYDSIVTAPTYTNVDVIKTTAFSLATAGTTAADLSTIVINSSGQQLQEVAETDIDLVASIGKYYYHTDKTVWFIRLQGEKTNIADYRTTLGTSGIQYSLATPIITNLTTEGKASGSLKAFKDGTIYQDCVYNESVVADADPKLTVTALREITQVTYVDETTDEVVEVPISGLTLSTDGTEITGTGITDGERYKVKGYLSYNISPLLTGNVPVNQSAVIVSLNSTVGQLSTQIRSNTDIINLIIAGL